jgi:hypothetical protein
MKFNRISFEINRILVQEVIGPFMTAPPAIGQRIRFVGAAEVVEDATEKHDFGDVLAPDVTPSHHLLKVVPIRLELE